jgi:FkbM family methyltransferase
MKKLFKRVLNKLSILFLDRLHTTSIISKKKIVFFENLYSIIRRKKFRFSYNEDTNVFKITENNRSCFFSDIKRGFSIYRNGIDHREDFLFSSYCLQNITFNSHDVVLDCGANSGDLFLKLNKFIDSGNYIAVEPNPADFKILSLNVPKECKLINIALGNVNSKLSFYVSTSSGDSSLIEPVKYDNIIKVDVVRLDDLLLDLKKKKIKLLKLEAEGFEPEILEGLGSSIKYCEYISVDGGYERGINAEQTLTSITNYLLTNGFEIVDIYFPWHRALFKKTNISNKIKI